MTDEQIAFETKYRELGELLDAAVARDRAEMEADGIYPTYLGITYEGTAVHPEFTVTKWLVNKRRVEVRKHVSP